jgi:hypothetical protein
MPVKIDNLSGLSYDDDIEFNSASLEDVVLFNGFPVNTETFLSGTNYVWSFYTASTRGDSDPDDDMQDSTQLHDDLTQQVNFNTEWYPRGWYKPLNSSDYLNDRGFSVSETRDILGNQRAWQVENRLGVGHSNDTALTDLALGYHNESTGSFSSSVIGAIYNQQQSPGSRGTIDGVFNIIDDVSDSGQDGQFGWINGSSSVFPVKLETSSDNPTSFRDVTTDWRTRDPRFKTKGWSMGFYGREIENPAFGSFQIPYGHGTPSHSTGPRGGPFPQISPLNHPTASIVEYTGDDKDKDRFLHVEYNIPDGGPNNFHVLRTPQRVFNYHPSASITRKFVGFFYHAYSIAGSGWTDMAKQQSYIPDTLDFLGSEVTEFNKNGYIISVWATQFRRTGFALNTYTHPGTGNVYREKLINHSFLDAPNPQHRVFLQTAPTFLGGVKIPNSDLYDSEVEEAHILHGGSDVGEFNQFPLHFNNFWSEFPSSGSDWKSKVLEIPDSAFDYDGGMIIARHDTTAEPEVIYDSDPQSNTGLYIYIVASGPPNIYCDISICNLQIAEYDNALVPQSVLDQLSVGVLDLT